MVKWKVTFFGQFIGSSVTDVPLDIWVDLETLPGHMTSAMSTTHDANSFVDRVQVSVLPEFLDDTGALNQLSSFGTLASGLVFNLGTELMVDTKESVLTTRSDPNWVPVLNVNYHKHRLDGFGTLLSGASGSVALLAQIACIHLVTGVWVEQDIPFRVELWYRTMTPPAIQAVDIEVKASSGFGSPSSWTANAGEPVLAALQALGISQE